MGAEWRNGRSRGRGSRRVAAARGVTSGFPVLLVVDLRGDTGWPGEHACGRYKLIRDVLVLFDKRGVARGMVGTSWREMVLPAAV